MDDIKPLVSVIVQHHLDVNRPYLDLCLKALARTSGVAYETIVIADSETKPEVPDGMRLVYNPELNSSTKKIHHGIDSSHPESKYFLILSDDVVVGQYTIARLVHGVGDHQIISNPMSNSDNNGQFYADMPCGCETTIEEAEAQSKGHTITDMVDGWGEAYGGKHGLRLMVVRPYVCFYCTLIPRSVWNAVGKLDERLDVRHNDEDWCLRADIKGIKSVINFGTFALHFGSKTLNKVAPTEMRNEASRIFFDKWKMRA